MSVIFSRFVKLMKKSPLFRGMVSYSIIWPTSSLIQQSFEGRTIECGTSYLINTIILLWTLKPPINETWNAVFLPISENYDWLRCARYGLYGSCYVAPTLYTWLTIANIMWPGNNLKVGLIKTFVETITYTPFAMCSFYMFMSLLEMKSFDEALAEVKAKFLPTYKIGASVWPAVAMVNFCLIAPRNRVAFISGCSLIWTSFLAYMKHLEKDQVPVVLLKK